jgi:hypothetical protein
MLKCQGNRKVVLAHGEQAREKVKLREPPESRQGRPESSRGCSETEPPDIWHKGFGGQGGDCATRIAPAAARQRHGGFPASSVRVRSGHFRSPPFSKAYFTPGSAALHPGLRSGHPSGVSSVWFSLAWLPCWLAGVWPEVRPRSGQATVERGDVSREGTDRMPRPGRGASLRLRLGVGGAAYAPAVRQ